MTKTFQYALNLSFNMCVTVKACERAERFTLLSVFLTHTLRANVPISHCSESCLPVILAWHPCQCDRGKMFVGQMFH